MIISGIVLSSLARANFRWEAEVPRHGSAYLFLLKERGRTLASSSPPPLPRTSASFLENANRKRKNDGGESESVQNKGKGKRGEGRRKTSFMNTRLGVVVVVARAKAESSAVGNGEVKERFIKAGTGRQQTFYANILLGFFLLVARKSEIYRRYRYNNRPQLYTIGLIFLQSFLQLSWLARSIPSPPLGPILFPPPPLLPPSFRLLYE